MAPSKYSLSGADGEDLPSRVTRCEVYIETIQTNMQAQDARHNSDVAEIKSSVQEVTKFRWMMAGGFMAASVIVNVIMQVFFKK